MLTSLLTRKSLISRNRINDLSIKIKLNPSKEIQQNVSIFNNSSSFMKNSISITKSFHLTCIGNNIQEISRNFQSRGRPSSSSQRGNYDLFSDLFDDLSSASDAPLQEAKDMSRYEAAKIDVKGSDVPSPISKFTDLDFTPKILQNLKNMGYQDPIPVQKYSLPIINSQRDLMSCAQTGSGKTAAFLLPIINGILKLKENPPHDTGKFNNQRQSTDGNKGFSAARGNSNFGFGREQRGFGSFSRECAPHALIIAPTRELVQQILNEAQKFTAGTRIKTAACFGGAPPGAQLERIQGADILVVTPGRYNDFVERGNIEPSKIKYFVLDEADRMLDVGFGPVIQEITSMPSFPAKSDRQTLLFSATFPNEIQSLAKKLLREDHLFLTVGRIGSATELIKQNFVETANLKDKEQALLDLLQEPDTGKTLVFCSTKAKVDEVGYALNSLNIPSATIHGDFSQGARNNSIRRFMTGEAQVLVATDVAARGLDIKDINTVVNFDLPNEVDDYVHRIGRTGRAGRKGNAYSFISPSDDKIVRDLIEVAQEARNEIPDWMQEMGMRRGGGSGDGRRGSFGGRNYSRRNNYRNNNNFSRDRDMDFAPRNSSFGRGDSYQRSPSSFGSSRRNPFGSKDENKKSWDF